MSSTAAATQVAELVRALALGWKNLAAYPPGHPALVSSLDLVSRRLGELRGPAGEVTLGIDADALVYGADRIDSTTAQKFAQALYTRGVAVLRFDSETKPQDIETFLRLLATPAEKEHPIWEQLTSAGVLHINLQPVDYSRVQVTDRLDAPPPEEKQRSLWEEILRALMEGQELSLDAREFLSKEHQSVTELVRLILHHVDEISAPAVFDPDATFGVRMPLHDLRAEAHARIADAVARFVAEGKGQKRESALTQAINLLRTLPQPLRGTVLRRVAEVLATDDSAAAALRQLAAELPHDEVLEALRHLSSMTNLSAHAVTLLESLTAMQTSTRAEAPSESVIADLVRLFGEEDIDRFNPPDHAALLAQVSIHVPFVAPTGAAPAETLGKRTETVAEGALGRQLGRTILEILPALGATATPQPILARLEALFRAHLTAGEFEEAFELTQKLNEIATTTDHDELRHAIHEFFGQLSTPEMIRTLVESLHAATPEKARVLQRLTEALGAGARRNLLMALCEETNRSRRRRLFDFITSLGPVIAPEATAFLSDTRWYVLRNMIVMLRSVNDRTSLPELRKLAAHRDLRVRMEAIKSLFTLDTGVSMEQLENVIHDPDPKVAETAVTLVGSARIREGVVPLLRIVSGSDIFGSRRSLRVKAIRALGELGEASALPALGHFFRDSLWPWPAKDERHAAWESLAGYPPGARAELVERGLRSRDAQVREMCERMK
ncbi:MAG TPA: HEAT repeat domain-containing protein [Thermoanaerobaculia bacterium]|nr:HEAT repeat domain-containing protein [Thermoanaerobaculia bacterium]